MNRIPCNTSFNIRWWLKSKCTWMYRSVRKLTLLISLLWVCPSLTTPWNFPEIWFNAMHIWIIIFPCCIFFKIVHYCNVITHNVYRCISIAFIHNLFSVGIYADNVRLSHDKLFFIRTTEGCRISRHKQNEKLLHCQFLSDYIRCFKIAKVSKY